MLGGFREVIDRLIFSSEQEWRKSKKKTYVMNAYTRDITQKGLNHSKRDEVAFFIINKSDI